MAYESDSIFWIETEKIFPNPYQPRREFDQKKLQELADSIRMYGILQPLVATRREVMRDDGTFSAQYELIAGERRLRASKIAGLSQVPVIIRSGEETELMKLELAIIENLQREDLNAVDRAQAFKQLTESFGLSHGQIADKVGKSREYVSNSIRLLMLPDTILGALRLGDISDGHARTLLMLNDRPEEQDIVFREILLKKLSVREVERISRKIATEKVRKHAWKDSDLGLIEIERQFMETLGTRVQISKTEFGGKLTIDYFSDEDLHKLLMLMNSAEVTLRGNGGDETGNMLARITTATPLTAEAAIAEERPEPPETPVTAAYPGEEMFTRYDSLDEEQPTEAIIEPVTPEPAVIAESPVAASTYSYQEPAQEFVLPPSEHVAAPTQSENIPDPAPVIEATVVPVASPVPSVLSAEPEKNDDADLYSIRNFSL